MNGDVDLEEMVRATHMQLTPKGFLLCEVWEEGEKRVGRKLTPDETSLMWLAFDSGWDQTLRKE